MVMRCVFKHHVYLCVVSTALMAGLALTSHTSKAYANQNCGSGSGAKTISDNVGPIVCDSGVTRTLNSSRGGDINIDMDEDMGSGEAAGAAVTVTGPGTNITIGKTLKVTGGLKGKPVIKVERGGALTLVEEVNVKGAGATIKKAIVVEGQGSSVTLNGKLTGFEGGEVKVSKGGTVVLGEGVEGIEGMKVKINDGGMVNMMGDVAFNNGEAGIKITGSRGNASVMGMGKTMTVTKGGGIQMDGDGGTASVVMLNIVGSGMGVDMQGTGTLNLTSVGISEFRVGVNAKNGTVNINGNSTITVTNSGTGIMVGSGATVKMMGGKD
ncbi:hypothetical protein [Bartonella bovis]|nr:hypothetical protein [Bartonella bovis]